MIRFTDLTVCGMWVDNGVSEDCHMLVGWRNTITFPEILAVEECHGVISGTNYIDRLMLSPALRDHLRDMICEIYEV